MLEILEGTDLETGSKMRKMLEIWKKLTFQHWRMLPQKIDVRGIQFVQTDLGLSSFSSQPKIGSAKQKWKRDRNEKVGGRSSTTWSLNIPPEALKKNTSFLPIFAAEKDWPIHLAVPPSPCHQSQPELLVAQCCGRWNHCRPCRSSAYHLRNSDLGKPKFHLGRGWTADYIDHVGSFPPVFWGLKDRRIARTGGENCLQPQTVEGFETVHKAIGGRGADFKQHLPPTALVFNIFNPSVPTETKAQ